MSITYDLNVFLELIPDAEIYKLSDGKYCKHGTEFYVSTDDRYSAKAREADNYKSEVENCGVYDRFAYFLYSAFPYQKEHVNIPGIYSVMKKLDFPNYVQSLYKFGIYDSTEKVTLPSKERCYIVPIEGSNTADVVFNFTNFLNQNIGDSKICYTDQGELTFYNDAGEFIGPEIHLYLTKETAALSPNEINKILRGAKNLELTGYPIINFKTADYNLINTQRAVQEYIKFYENIGIKALDVTHIADRFYKEIYGNNNLGYTALNQAIEDIKKLVDENGGCDKTIVYSLRVESAYISLLVALKYLYNIACIQTGFKDQYFSELSSLYLSDKMLAGDKYNYLRNFPTYSVRNEFYGSLVFHLLNREMDIYTTAAELGDDLSLGTPISLTIQLSNKDVKFENTTSIFNFDKDGFSNSKEDDKQKKMFLEFYKKMKEEKFPNLDFPNPCNTLILTVGEKRYLARVNKVSGIAFSGIMGHLESQTISEYTLKSMSDLYHWVPMRAYNDYETGLRMISMLERQIRFTDNSSIVEPLRISDIRTIYYRFFYESSMWERGSELIPNSFVAANVNVRSAYIARSNKIWMDMFDNSDNIIKQLTSFYCTDPTIAVEVCVTEDMLVDKYVEGGFHD